MWDEVYPFVDERAARSAEALNLPATGEGLSRLVERQDFARLVAALVRVGLAKGHDALLAQAR